VNTVPERSYNHQINVILTRYVPGLAEGVTRTFSLGEASRLEELFRECGFSQIETRTVKHTFVLPSFDAYYGPFERGGASTGHAFFTTKKNGLGMGLAVCRSIIEAHQGKLWASSVGDGGSIFYFSLPVAHALP
jgi:Histidine kinase-, DNA gyrase B-, and HSP90-like ATPase